MKTFKKVLTVLNLLLLLIISVAIIASFYVKITFPMVTIDELYFYWTNGVTNSNSDVFISAFQQCVFWVLLVFTILFIILYDISFGHFKLRFLTNFLYKNKVKEKKEKVGKIQKNKTFDFQVYPFKIVNNHRVISTLAVIAISLYIITNNLNCIRFIQNTSTKSKFIEINYVAPEEVKIEFNEKRNLIYIFVESLETSFFTKDQGGFWDYEVIPGLYSLLNEDDSIVFYNNDNHELMTMLDGNGWTTAGIVANSTGLPFKVPIDGNEYHSENFMNGSYALGDLLKDNGYHNEVISTARTTFGGVREFYSKHGSYKIIDANTLKENNFVLNKSDRNDWGFNDKFLFEIAKERLTFLSKQPQPFNLQLITIDTHFTDGYKYSFTTNEFDTQYENVYATSSKLIYDFISWVKDQDFYENTTIVIVGDHISMQEDFFSSRGIKTNERYIYNCYINSAVEPNKTEGRIYTELDSYPSIIAAIGGEISGNRLGLGVNLFSKQKTLAEKYGMKELNEETIKKSTFYNEKILGSDYTVMMEKYGITEEDEEEVQKN